VDFDISDVEPPPRRSRRRITTVIPLDDDDIEEAACLWPRVSTPPRDAIPVAIDDD
jgi:hypothetical protein